MTKDILLEIGRQYQARYSHLKEIDSLTDQVLDAFGRNDTRSASMLLEMRAGEMEKADLCREEAGALMKEMAGWEISALDRLLHAGRLDADGLYEPFTEELREAARMIAAVSIRSREILKDTITKDERLNRRIAGKNTFYQRKD